MASPCLIIPVLHRLQDLLPLAAYLGAISGTAKPDEEGSGTRGLTIPTPPSQVPTI